MKEEYLCSFSENYQQWVEEDFSEKNLDILDLEIQERLIEETLCIHSRGISRVPVILEAYIPGTGDKKTTKHLRLFFLRCCTLWWGKYK